MKNKTLLTIVTAIVLSTSFIACGNSEKKDEAPTETSTEAKTYACPMHANITSDKPGSCSECGMDLEEVKK